MALISNNPSSSSSSSSSNTSKFKHDVFLSFRGEDTHISFIGHLYQDLSRKQIETYIDYELNRGDEISPSLFKAIEESKISVIIFSKDYASSRWCLQELVKILECKKSYGQTVIPVFYNVDPSDVRHQTGSYADAFAKHEQRSLGKVQRWKDALKEAANLSGWDSSTTKNEARLVRVIVKHVLTKLSNLHPSDTNNLVGIDSKIMEIKSWLDRETNDVRIVGIWGMGGIGKTTLAEAIFNNMSMSHQFEGSCFIHNVRERSEQSSVLNEMQRELLSAILGDGKVNIGTSMVGDTFIRKRIGHKKLLIALDDVSNFTQIESLIGSFDCFSLQSRFIITSRDKQVLINCRADRLYEVQELIHRDALELLYHYAFARNLPPKGYMDISERVAKYTGGNPLTLKVIGLFLQGKGTKVWEDALSKLETIPHPDIYTKLKISYDGLNDELQKIFLDIACFFKWSDIGVVELYLKACGFSAHGIDVLVQKSLITLSGKLVTMHDSLQAMGKETVRQESIDDPGERSRLFLHKEIYQVLAQNEGTKKIVGISLNMSKVTDIHLDRFAFAKMVRLRILKFYVSCDWGDNGNELHISQGLESIFSELRYLHWYKCSFKSLQSNFNSRNLVILEMPNSNVEELWSHVQQLDNLIKIDLRGSKRLTFCPDLSGTPNLERLILANCTCLCAIPSSIKHLSKLEALDLSYCTNLASIPDCIGLQSLKKLYVGGCSRLNRLPELPNNIETLDLNNTPIEELPSSIEDLYRLDDLNLTGCSKLKSLPSCVSKWKSLRQLQMSKCLKVDKFPDDIGTLESLSCLNVEETSVREVPSSMSDLKGLYYLSFSRCRGEDGVGLILSPLLELHNLTLLYLSDSGISELPESLGCLTSLVRLYLDKNNFESIPESIIDLCKLEFLNISYCKRLKDLPKLRWTCIDAVNCTSLKVLRGLSFQNDESALYSTQSIIEARFINCFELDRNLLKDVVKEVLLELQGLVKKIYHDQAYEVALQPVSIFYPESVIPNWFNSRSRGSNVELPLEFSHNLICFALCAVLEFPDHQRDHNNKHLYASYECNVKSKDGDSHVYSDHLCAVPYSGPSSNHVILGFNFQIFHEFYDNKLSFQFYVKDENELVIEYCKVIESGVYLMFGQHLEEAEFLRERNLTNQEASVRLQQPPSAAALTLVNQPPTVVDSFQCLEKSTHKALYHGKTKRKLNPTIEIFSKLVDRCVKQDTSIRVDHEEDMYGDQSQTFITLEDCHAMINKTELTVSCIDIYIRGVLYEQLKEDDMLGQFAFINPASVSVAGGPMLGGVKKERGSVIASCLQRATTSKLIFMPYNPGFHWILVVIDMRSMKIYYLNSLGGSVDNDSFLKDIMQIGLTIYRNQSDQGDVQWNHVQVPMQSGNIECGYYVLRFMKDIIADISLLTENSRWEKTYTEKEIDKVRCEWATFFSRYL